jgi:Uma2 family endonuclease
MATSGARHHHYTYDDYLDHDDNSPGRHEFLDGQIHAIAGGSPQHAAICAHVIAALDAQLRGRGYEVYSSDLRVRVIATGLATYPDATVICGALELDPSDPKRHTATNPMLLVEVLSPSTADYDRGDKLDNYKLIPSLREVVLVAYDERLVEVWRRGESDHWVRREARTGVLELTALGGTLDVEDVFRGWLAR